MDWVGKGFESGETVVLAGQLREGWMMAAAPTGAPAVQAVEAVDTKATALFNPRSLVKPHDYRISSSHTPRPDY